MAKYTQIKRWEIIIQLVERIPYISKQSLIDRMEEDHDIKITARTLERDLSSLATDFGVFVSYDRQQKGYFIAADNQEQVYDFLKFSGHIFMGEFFRETLKDFEDLKERIKPEDNADYAGSIHIQSILMALRSHREIGFVHENFQKNTLTPYQIVPLQLREYGRRWYVVGVPKGESHFKTFGLSRISQLKILGISSLDPLAFEEQLKKFDRIIGLNYNAAEKAETVRIVVSAEQYKYLKTLPLHFSQEHEKTLLDGRVQLKLFLIPNHELNMQLLKMGNQVEVLEPLFVRNQIIDLLRQSLALYQD
ncbi:MAG TPA: WYL domain-containing protein [Moheibacter sp.]|nr:WYL domain-containing protein [Moheibacter sp.]